MSDQGAIAERPVGAAERGREDEGAAAAPSRTTDATPSWRATATRVLSSTWFLVAVVVISCVSIVAIHAAHERTLSQWDETAHIDSLLKARAGHVPHLAEQIGQSTAREISCRRVDSGWSPPPCQPRGAAYDTYVYAWGGENSAAIHPPLYYFVTATLAEPVYALPGVRSFVTAGRVVGGLWLAGGLLLIWYAAGLLGASRLGRAAAVLLFGTSPVIIYNSSTVNNDAAMLFAGALVLAAGMRLALGRRFGAAGLIAAAVVAVMLKTVTIVTITAVAAMLAYFAWRGVLEVRRRAALLAAGASLVAAGIAIKAWSAVLTHISGHGTSVNNAPRGIDANAIPQAFGGFSGPLSWNWLPAYMRDVPWTAPTVMIANLIVVAAVGALVLGRSATVRQRGLGIAAVLATMLGPVGLYIVLAAGGYGVGIPATRYGLCTYALAAVCVAVAVESVAAAWVIIGISLVSVTEVAWLLLT
jgi:hypothetical protein